MSNQQNGNGSGQKKAKSDFVVACNGVKMALKGRLARPHIISTFDYQNKGFPKHSTYLIVDPNDPKVIQMANAFRAIKQQFFPNMPDLLWSNPIKDARTPFKPDGSEWQDWQKGNVFIAVSTGADYPPTALVKDPSAPKGYREATVLDEKKFYYDGADAVVEFAAGGMEGNTKGINLYFNGILGLGTGERIVIASSGSFNAEEAFGEFLGATAGGMNNMGNQNFNGQGQNMNNGQTNNQQQQQYNQNGNNMGNGGYQNQQQNAQNWNGNSSQQQNNSGGQQMNAGGNGGYQGQNQNTNHGGNYNQNNNGQYGNGGGSLV